jgi:two-component system sensor histidine kinase KdpD
VRGRLLIFFGMAPGTGKTRRMLEEGRRRKAAGQDVVIGYLGRGRGLPEPSMDLERVPVLAEGVDVEALARRAPAAVLVDGLAGTNAAGATNRKRFQDVLELLGRGIDVITTVNLYELEQAAGTVEELAGVRIGERVPDAVFEAAAEVVLCDLPVDELLESHAAGKLRPGSLSPAAAAALFRPEILSHLRGMALSQAARFAGLRSPRAEAVRAELSHAGAGKQPLRLLVAVSESPNSKHLIDWTRQRAQAARAEWVALHVKTGRPLSGQQQEALRENLDLARQLGAEVVSLPSDSVTEAVFRYARANGVAQIVVGKSGSSWREGAILRRSLTDRFVGGSGDIDIVVLKERGRPLSPAVTKLSSWLGSEAASLLKALAVAVLVTGGSLLLLPYIGYRSVSILFLLAIIALAFWVSRPAVLLASVLFGVLWDLLFIPPRFVFTIGHLEDVLMFALFLLTAAALGFLMSRLRSSQQLLSAREHRLSLLFSFSQALSLSTNLEKILQTALEHLTRHFEAPALVLLRDSAGRLEAEPRCLEVLRLSAEDLQAARWSFENRLPGPRLAEHSATPYRWIPLLTPEAAVGVLGIQQGERRDADQEDLLQMLGRSLALSLERELLADAHRRNAMARESERLGRVLLNTISHELRTPLTTIKGSITALQDQSAGGDPEARSILLAETLEATDRLNGIVDNLLSMSRLEAGRLKLKKTSADPADLASVAAGSATLAGHPLEVRVEEDLPAVEVDFVLFVQALANVIQNAANHTPAGTPIELAVTRKGSDVRIVVADSGPGVPAEELPRLFETFFRGSRAATGGVGLGLAICKGIVEAHGGNIRAFLNPRGGLSVAIEMPGSPA